MTSRLHLAAFVLCVIAAYAILQAAKALIATSKHVRWSRSDTYIINRMLPNAKDRDTEWDYIDQKAWVHLSGLKMWGCLAGISLLGVVILLSLAP
jgi:hypothetical protein